MGSITVGISVSSVGNVKDTDSGVILDALTITCSTDLDVSAKMEKEGRRTQTYGRRAWQPCGACDRQSKRSHPAATCRSVARAAFSSSKVIPASKQ